MKFDRLVLHVLTMNILKLHLAVLQFSVVLLWVVTTRIKLGRLCTCVCVFLYQQHYCKRNQPISLKLDVMIGPTSPLNQLTLGGDPVLNIDSVSLFHFHQD